MKKMVLKTSALSLAVAMASAAQAGMDDVRINAFGSVGAATLSGEPDQVRYGRNSEYKDGWAWESVTRGAVQASYDITDSLTATGQILVDRNGNKNGFEADVEWAYLGYDLLENMELRGGILRASVYLLSETLDVGYSYPWVRPPQTFYSMVPFSNYYGADVLHRVEIGDTTEILFQAFVGRVEENDVAFGGFDDTDIDAKDMYGVNATWSDEFGSIRIGVLKVEDADVTFDGTPPNFPPAVVDAEVMFYSIGYRVEKDNWVSMGEYGKVDFVEGTNFRAQGPETDGGYIMGGYRFGSFLPHVTYSRRSTTGEGTQPGGSPTGKQDGYTLGLRYDWKPGIAIKAEYENLETEGNFAGGFSGQGPTADSDGEIFSVAVDFVM